MKYYQGEDGATCEFCYKMAHYEIANGEILCQEHARKHPEYPAFKAERERSKPAPDSKPSSE